MELSPRYDGPCLLRYDTPLGDPATPMVRQRERLAGVLAGLDDEQWAAPSRCAGWSVQDVMKHLTTANQFWALSIASARQGQPTRFLASFDPVATPASMVEAVRGQQPGETLSQFEQSIAAIAEAEAGMIDADWLLLAESPLGHVPIRALAAHALWDSWVHERDVMLPIGLDPVEEPDEIAVCLSYVAALSPAFLASTGSTRTGAIALDATDPPVELVIELGDTVVIRAGSAPAGALHLTGDAVTLTEALSFRAPSPWTIAASDEWMLTGLAAAFDRVG